MGPDEIWDVIFNSEVDGDSAMEASNNQLTNREGTWRLWCKVLIHDTIIEMKTWDGAIILETELDLFKFKQFESEIILLTIRWYLKYSLSDLS